MDDQILFTPSALLDFLIQIDEFKDEEVGVAETADGNLQVNIGNSVYTIDCSKSEEITVDPEAVEQVADLNEDTYTDIIESNEDVVMEDDEKETDEEVTAGLLAEAAKCLAIGGLARLAGKTIKTFVKSR